MERYKSGLTGSPGKTVCGNAPRVRIPPSPPFNKESVLLSFAEEHELGRDSKTELRLAARLARGKFQQEFIRWRIPPSPPFNKESVLLSFAEEHELGRGSKTELRLAARLARGKFQQEFIRWRTPPSPPKKCHLKKVFFC